MGRFLMPSGYFVLVHVSPSAPCAVRSIQLSTLIAESIVC